MRAVVVAGRHFLDTQGGDFWVGHLWCDLGGYPLHAGSDRERRSLNRHNLQVVEPGDLRDAILVQQMAWGLRVVNPNLGFGLPFSFEAL